MGAWEKMVRPLFLSFAVGVTASILLASGVVARASAGADVSQVPRTYVAYAGHILSGTGAYRGAAGAVVVLAESRLLKGGSRPFLGGDEYAVSIVFHGAGCHMREAQGGRRRCVVLSGAIAGTAISEPRLPDLPSFNRLVSLAGQVGPLGSVTALGRMGGTGYIHRGHRSLFVVLTGARGSIALGGIGPAVPGFQAP